MQQPRGCMVEGYAMEVSMALPNRRHTRLSSCDSKSVGYGGRRGH